MGESANFWQADNIGSFQRKIRKWLCFMTILDWRYIRKYTNNGVTVLVFSPENKQAVINALFKQKIEYKTTLMHQRSDHWHLVDHIRII